MDIQSTYCECPKGEYKCSHAAALYIHGIHNLSRTDIECQWKRKRSADCLVSSNAEEIFPSKNALTHCQGNQIMKIVLFCTMNSVILVSSLICTGL